MALAGEGLPKAQVSNAVNSTEHWSNLQTTKNIAKQITPRINTPKLRSLITKSVLFVCFVF